MPKDAYIKFGESDNKSPAGRPLPLIEGDSSDEFHYYWCELRSCDIELKASESSKDSEERGAEKGKESRPEFEPVTLTKRVDWASTQLFMKVCEAAEASGKKSDEESGKGRIDQVTIEVCRQSGEKFPYLVVTYYGVTVIHYGITINKPEPEETITFKFEDFKFCYQQTSNETGKPKGNLLCTPQLTNHQPAAPVAGQVVAASAGSTGAGNTAAAVGVAAAVVAATTSGAAGGGGLPAGTASATDAAASSNFPGLIGPNGFGILPD